MIQIKDTFVTLDNIKTVTFKNAYGPVEPCLVIKHFYDEELVEIPVRDFEEYEELARMIVEIMREEKKRGA